MTDINTRGTFIHLLDHFGRKPNLFIGRHSRYGTLLGASSTIIVLCITTASLLYFLIEFIIGSGMTVMYSKENLHENTSYSFNHKVFLMRYADIEGNPVDPRISSLVGLYMQYHRNEIKSQKIPIEPCSYDRHFLNDTNKDFLKTVNIEKFQCFPPDFSFTLYSDKNEFNSSLMSIFIDRCVNSTENNNSCLSNSEIDEALRKSYNMIIIFEDPYIDHFNFGNPFIRKLETYSKQLSFSLKYDYILNWKKIIYKSDHGVFYNYWKSYIDFQFDFTSQETLIHINPENYIANGLIKFQLSLFNYGTEQYIREFPKIQDVIASVSGIINFAIHFGSVLVKVLTKGQYYSDLAFTLNKKSTMNNQSFNKFNMNNKTCRNVNSIELSNPVKSTKVSSCISLAWIIAPRSNLQTVNLTKCRLKITNVLCIENIMKKMFYIDRLSLKNNENYNMSYSVGDSFNKPKANIPHNNFLSPINSFMSSKNEWLAQSQNRCNHNKNNEVK